jgi:hypothetical protein
VTKNKSAPLDMHSIIVSAIVNGENIPLKMSNSEKKEFAKKIADACHHESFEKSRDKFKKDVDMVIKSYMAKHS